MAMMVITVLQVLVIGGCPDNVEVVHDGIVVNGIVIVGKFGRVELGIVGGADVPRLGSC